MKETIIGLIGVIIGAIIGIIGQALLFRFEYKKWRKEAMIKYLKDKREELEKKYEECREKIWDGMKTNSYNVDMVFTFKSIFPKNVCEAFDELMESEKPIEERKFLCWHVIDEMKKSLAEIDDKIEKEINK